MNHNQSLTFTKEIKSWIAYDAGNSAFATTVIAAFFPLFFSSYWAGNIDEITSAKYFTAGLTIMNLVILIGMPIIGAITDVKNLTKTFFSVFSFLGALLVISFAFVSENEWLFALILYGTEMLVSSNSSQSLPINRLRLKKVLN